MVMVESKTVLAAAAATAGVAFLGYCVYFDRKRRSDPDFKKKLRERRMKNKKCTASSGGSSVQFPDASDPEALQQFFLREVTKGEESLAAGQIEEGVDHLSNAVTVCGQPQQLLQVLQQTLPPQVFQLLIARLASQQHRGPVLQQAPPPAESGPTISELDVE